MSVFVMRMKVPEISCALDGSAVKGMHISPSLPLSVSGALGGFGVLAGGQK